MDGGVEGYRDRDRETERVGRHVKCKHYNNKNSTEKPKAKQS